MRERFSHRGRDLVIRPLGVLLAYECLFEATHGPVQIARGAPALTGRHLTKSRDLHLAGLGSKVHPVRVPRPVQSSSEVTLAAVHTKLPVPPQNPIRLRIVDVSALRGKLADPDD